jgi:diacylglycerol kinase
LVTIAGFYFNISATEWLFQTLAIGFVMIEGLNTAVEKIADFLFAIIMKGWFHQRHCHLSCFFLQV